MLVNVVRLPVFFRMALCRRKKEMMKSFSFLGKAIPLGEEKLHEDIKPVWVMP